MIELLTAEQEARLEEFRDKWLAIGLTCKPLNFEKAKEAAIAAYKVAGLAPPKIFLHAQSPWHCAWMLVALNEPEFAALINEGKSQKEIEAKLNRYITKNRKIKLDKNFKIPIETINNQIYGSQDAGWLSFYDFFLEVCKLDVCEKLKPLIELAKHCGWWAPYEKFCILQDRPEYIHLNEERQLHRDGGPAIKYSDGFSVYAWNGIRVPKKYGNVRSEEWKAEWLISEENTEYRRILIEGIGYSRIVEELNGKLIHKDGDMQLIEIIDRVDVEPIRILKVVCPSTQSIHGLRVPPNINICEEARRWTFGDDKLELLAEA